MEEKNVKTELATLINGLDVRIAQEINAEFLEFTTQLKEITDKAAELVVTDESQAGLMKQAKEARLILKNIRINADKKRKDLKEGSLKYGNAVQAVYNYIENEIKPLEKHLEAQEKFKEVQEEKRLNILRAERKEILSPLLGFYPALLDLGILDQDEFNSVKAGAEYAKKAKEDQEAEAKIKALADQEENKRLEDELNAKNAEIEALKKAAKKANEAAAALELLNQSLKIEGVKDPLDALDEINTKGVTNWPQNEIKKDFLIVNYEGTDEEKLKYWIDSFIIPPAPFDNEKTEEIKNKFKGFKTWAKIQL
jgi:hypothetical protein